MRVLVAGEGRFELGEYDKEPAWRSQNREIGFIEAAIKLLAGQSAMVESGVHWRRIPKYISGRSAGHEARTVAGLAQLARDSAYDVVVFARDRDRDEAREREIEAALAASCQRHAGFLRIAGGVARECADGWLLAWVGTRRTETLSTEAAKAERERLAPATSSVAEVLASAGVQSIADDATSLLLWVERVRQATTQ